MSTDIKNKKPSIYLKVIDDLLELALEQVVGGLCRLALQLLDEGDDEVAGVLLVLRVRGEVEVLGEGVLQPPGQGVPGLEGEVVAVDRLQLPADVVRQGLLEQMKTEVR